ncbi:MAG: DEAD/DEAH box helicase [Patescibacteria group bacterium]
MTPQPQSFDELGIAPKILDILDRLKFAIPTPIQHQTIPIAIEGKDVMGIAQTGTGKTLAFGVPMIQRLAQTKGTGLVILPTRELAVQVDEELNKIGRSLGLKTAIIIGGGNMRQQIFQLQRNPHIVIATPGRLIDHLERKTIKLDKISVLVLDEADRMLDMGFAPQIKKILQTIPRERQTMLFSATMPSEIVNIANNFMRFPIRIEITPAGSVAADITHEIFFVRQESKPALLETLLKEYKGSILVFSRTKHGAKKIALAIRKTGCSSTEMHSNCNLNQRLRALADFKNGRARVMVATDVASRGIDVKNIETVINYDLPEKANDYVHRVGRTGRAGHVGHAISFATPAQKRDVLDIERLIKKTLPVSKRSGLTAETADNQNSCHQPHTMNRGKSAHAYSGKPREFSHGSRGRFSQNNSRRKNSNSSGRFIKSSGRKIG